MRHTFTLPILLLAGGICLTVAAAEAQEQGARRGPPPLPAGDIAAELGVSEGTLTACMGARPEPGQRPPKPDAGKIASCLSKTKAGVTASTVDGVLAAYAPKPRQ